MVIKVIQFTSKDDSNKEISERLKEKFKLHQFKYAEDTLNMEEKQTLLKHGTKFQMFKDGKIKDNTEEFTHFINNEPASKALQAWFKYQALLKEEDEARKLENKKRAREIKPSTPYHGQ